jgi:hypothetical protein
MTKSCVFGGICHLAIFLVDIFYVTAAPLNSHWGLEYSSVTLDDDGTRFCFRAQLRSSLSARLPCSSLEQLRHAELRTIHTRQDHRVKFVDQNQRHRPPFNNDIITCRERREGFTGRLQPCFERVFLQRKHAHVDEQSTVAVLRQSGQGLRIEPCDSENALEWHHEGVCEPLCQLVEGLYELGFRLVVVSRACLFRKRTQGPGVANGRPVDGGTVLWPDGNQQCLQEIPEC